MMYARDCCTTECDSCAKSRGAHNKHCIQLLDDVELGLHLHVFDDDWLLLLEPMSDRSAEYVYPLVSLVLGVRFYPYPHRYTFRALCLGSNNS